MEVLVTQSDTPLVFDAIPAVKVRYYSRGGLPVYTYARVYVLGRQLVLNLCAFERTPAADSEIGFSVAGANGGQLYFSLTPQDARLRLLPEGKPPQSLPAPEPTRFAGVDEQGWHWGATAFLPASFLQKVGIVPAVGAQFRAAAQKSWRGKNAGAFGSSAPLDAAGQAAPADTWDIFTVVAY